MGQIDSAKKVFVFSATCVEELIFTVVCRSSNYTRESGGKGFESQLHVLLCDSYGALTSISYQGLITFTPDIKMHLEHTNGIVISKLFSSLHVL